MKMNTGLPFRKSESSARPNSFGILRGLVTRALIQLTLLSLYLLGTGSLTPAYSESSIYVTVRETKLRPKADFFSAGGTTLKYGDKLTVVDESEPWYSVKTAGGAQGYVHSSAITTRKVVLNSGAKFNSSQPSQEDVVLAGKGFSADVEKQFAASHRELNFNEVNSMEKIRVSAQEVQSFVKQGQLGQQES